MSNLIPFNYQEKQVRTILKNNEPWFVLKDVCDVLEISNSRNVAARLDVDEKGVHQADTLGGSQQMLIINEPGLYSVILRSEKPEAKQFKRWITHEVIPSIRKHGGYYVGLSKELQAIFITDQKIQAVETRVERLENTMTIDYSQQEVMRELANRTVMEALGGKSSTAYKLIGKRAFSEFWRYYKRVMQVNSYKNTAVADFDKAKGIVIAWKPDTELSLMIAGANIQRPA